MIKTVSNTPFTSVGIIGCGWLGTPLAYELQKNKVEVLATSSQLENVEKLNRQDIKALQLSLPLPLEQLCQYAVFAQKSLVIAITPQLKQGRTDYADKVKQIITAAEQTGVVERIVLLSSTAIYQGLFGEVDEQQKLNLTTEKSKILSAAEQACLSFSKQAVVLRLAGLVGPDRHPGKFLRANKILSNSSISVNLIHQQDAVGLVQALLLKDAPQGIFNGVSDTHVSKAEFYCAAAKSIGLQAPLLPEEYLVNTQPSEIDRIVSGSKAKQQLSYSFVYPNLLDWV